MSPRSRALLAAGILFVFHPVKAAPAAAPSAPPPAKPPGGPAETGPDGGATSSGAVYATLRAPLFADGFAATPVARVDGEFITARELAEVVAGIHAEHKMGDKAGVKDFRALVDRLVDARLIVLEAREEGLPELPEVKAKIDKLEETRLKEILKARAVKSVKADPAAVDRLYAETVTAYRLHALNFGTEEGARLALPRLQEPGRFAEMAGELVAAQQAQDSGDAFVSADQLLPEVRTALEKAKAGTVVGPVRASSRWLVAFYAEVRRREDPAARAQAEASVLGARRDEALQAYYRGLAKRHAQVDRQLLDALDYDAPTPGTEALAKDRRVVARVARHAITVAELTGELDKAFYHGVADAAEKKRANEKKRPVFDGLLFRYLLLDEAARQHLRESEEFKKPVREATDRLLFGKFLESAIAPSVKVSEEEAKRYYDEHPDEFTTPMLYRLESIAFTQVKGAEDALSKIKAGTDFKWMQENADGAIPSEKQKLKLDGLVLTASSLPEGLVKALSDAKEGDYRLYAGDSESHVVHVLKAFPAGRQPFPQMQEGITTSSSAARSVRPSRSGPTRSASTTRSRCI